jgi:hypothetical protein
VLIAAMDQVRISTARRWLKDLAAKLGYPGSIDGGGSLMASLCSRAL